MSKCASRKRATMRIEQYCKRRKDRMKPKRQEDSSCVFAYYLSRHLPSPRYRRKRKRAEVASAQVKKRSFVKAVEMARHDSHQGRGKLPPCMPQSECGTGHTGYRIFSDPSPGGSQDTGGAFRSRVQRSGVRHRSTGAGHIAPCGSVLTWHK